MKLNSALVLWAFTAAFIVAAGCTSFGGSGSPGATTQISSTVAPASTNPAIQGSVSPAMPRDLTEAQKSQAIGIVKADAAMKDVLNRPGYSVIGVVTGMDAGTAIVTIQGAGTKRADGSPLTTPDQYTVTVDLNKGKVADTVHVAPKSLPTPNAQ